MLIVLFGFCAGTPLVNNFWVLAVMQFIQGLKIERNIIYKE